MIYHIATSEEWQTSVQKKNYTPQAFAKEGFIHASKKHQLKGVVARYYQNQSGLLVLEIDELKLLAELKYEPSTNNELYPHIYGAINTDAIVKVTTLESFMNPYQE